jgi:hypothetical protein
MANRLWGKIRQGFDPASGKILDIETIILQWPDCAAMPMKKHGNNLTPHQTK